MSKELLKKYISDYGEVQAIKDIASILQDLSDSWSEAGNKPLTYTFSDAANMVAEVASKLEVAETLYAKSQGTDNTEENDHNRMLLEFNKLMMYFQTLSVKDLQKIYSKNKDELVSKLKRLEYLKKILDNKDDGKK